MKHHVFVLLFAFFWTENGCLPSSKAGGDEVKFTNEVSELSPVANDLLPFVEPQNDEDKPSNSGGLGGLIPNVIKNGVSAGAGGLSSPTMVIGGFSLLMQPMPNASQLMELGPKFLNLIPGVSGLTSGSGIFGLGGGGDNKKKEKL